MYAWNCSVTNYRFKLRADDNVEPGTQMKGNPGTSILGNVHTRKRNPLFRRVRGKKGVVCTYGELKELSAGVSIEFCGSCVRASLRFAPYFPSILRLFPSVAVLFFFPHRVGRNKSTRCSDRQSWIESKERVSTVCKRTIFSACGCSRLKPTRFARIAQIFEISRWKIEFAETADWKPSAK